MTPVMSVAGSGGVVIGAELKYRQAAVEGDGRVNQVAG
jgi:hypothetical protein